MKISKFFSFIFDYERKVYIILFALFFIGFTYGYYYSFCLNSCDYSDIQSSSIWINIILKELIFFFITFILGYTVIGFPLLCFNVIIYGVYFGIFLSRYAILYDVKGSLISGMMFFPYLFCSITLFILLTFSSIRMSVALFNVFKKGTRFISPKVYSLPHIIRFISYLAISILLTSTYSYILYPFVIKIL